MLEDNLSDRSSSRYLITSVILCQLPCFYINTSISFLGLGNGSVNTSIVMQGNLIQEAAWGRWMTPEQYYLHIKLKLHFPFFYSLILQIFFLTFGPRPASNCLLHNLKNWHLFVFRFRVVLPKQLWHFCIITLCLFTNKLLSTL